MRENHHNTRLNRKGVKRSGYITYKANEGRHRETIAVSTATNGYGNSDLFPAETGEGRYRRFYRDSNGQVNRTILAGGYTA
ncbi:hypothetical protein SAMN05192559_1065 [Halobacillus karajensis]|uniref:hypothetical protein n=1 Tax=Halobacillus karajensis TaxID=195088 RepID=UPI0008A7B121|nr:hypothetical protein [Halobacillus karajensis]SEH94686.1 hypothetical protein SAMN05192559_1065 [Halobacillus karajensis]